jgi:hypothetical protein
MYQLPTIMKFKFLPLFFALFTITAVKAQVTELADPLTMNNGQRVTKAKQWPARREELLQLFRTEMYGQAPPRPAGMKFKVFEQSENALGGIAIRKQVTVYFNGDPTGPQMDILIYLPKKTKMPAPLILQLGFNGNQTLSNDTAVKITNSWVANGTGVVDHKATEATRGKTTNADLEMILRRGYGFATIYCGDIDPDFDDDFKNGVQALYPQLQNSGDNFSTVGAWAWGLSRALDYMETDKAIDAKKVAVFGFSRLGKAAVWAGATDTRFAMVLSNESGAGGVKLFKRGKGEQIEHLVTAFPHWFDVNFRKYAGRDTVLPFDQHLVISLIAPRPIAIGSAEGDTNSDPEGEFFGGMYANPVYKLLGTTGLPATAMPAVNKPISGQIGYHIRQGGHAVLTYDWECYLNFMDQHFGKP